MTMPGDTLSSETRKLLEETGAPSIAKPFALDEVRRVVDRVTRSVRGRRS
jgi:hypothetical protein